MRAQAAETGDVQRMQAWAGQSVRLGRAEPAGRDLQRARHRPPGIVWKDLTPEKIEQIPALRRLRPPGEG